MVQMLTDTLFVIQQDFFLTFIWRADFPLSDLIIADRDNPQFFQILTHRIMSNIFFFILSQILLD